VPCRRCGWDTQVAQRPARNVAVAILTGGVSFGGAVTLVVLVINLLRH